MKTQFAKHMQDIGDVSKLVPELQEYVQQGPLGLMLQHPLVQQVFGIIPHAANEMLEQKERMLKTALSSEDYEGALVYYERPWRLHMLAQWWDARAFDIHMLRKILAWAWTDAENPHVIKSVVLPLFIAAREAGLVTDMEPASVCAIMHGPSLTLYRGVSNKRWARGMSWTRSPERAAWFAKRFNKGKGVVVSCTIPPDKFLGAFVGRGEDEVVLNPKQIRDIKIEEKE